MDDNNPNNNSEPIGGDIQPETEQTEESKVVVTETISSTEEPPVATSPSSGDDIVFTDKPKKGKAGLIIGIICALLILGGAGGFIAVYAINNQPENILMSSLDKFANAKNISTSGTINLDLDEDTTGIDNATLTLGVSTGTSDETGNLSLSVTMADGTQINDLSIGETLVNNGTLYLRFDGLEDLYDNYLSQYLSLYLPSYTTVSVRDYNTSNATVDVEYTTSTSNTISSYIADAASKLDGQWFEISIDDVLDNDYFSSMSSSDKKQIKTSYNCVVDTLKNGQKYSKEMNDLYSKHKFITMTSGQDSYYDISFAARPLADFLNAIPSTALVSDFTSCAGVDSSAISTVTVDIEAIEDILGQMPNVSAKFDGFLTHELSAIKIKGQNDFYTLNADLKFTYPDSLNISAPANATPIMDRVEDIITGLSELEQS